MNEAQRHEGRRKDLTPPMVADELGVSVTQVYVYFDTNDLRFWDAAKRGAKKRDLRVKREWLDDFKVKRGIADAA